MLGRVCFCPSTDCVSEKTVSPRMEKASRRPRPIGWIQPPVEACCLFCLFHVPSAAGLTPVPWYPGPQPFLLLNVEREKATLSHSLPQAFRFTTAVSYKAPGPSCALALPLATHLSCYKTTLLAFFYFLTCLLPSTTKGFARRASHTKTSRPRVSLLVPPRLPLSSLSLARAARGRPFALRCVSIATARASATRGIPK